MSRNISPEEKQNCESFAFPFMVAYTFSVLAPNTFRRLCPHIPQLLSKSSSPITPVLSGFKPAGE